MVLSLVARLGRCLAITAHPKLLAPLTPDRKLVWGRVDLPASIFNHRLLQVLLKERNIDVCCIQETHLNSSHRFSFRGDETSRRDRKDRLKGGILTLVKNTHAAAEIYRSEDEDTGVLGIKLYLTKLPSQSTIYTRHATNSCVPKFFSLTQTDGSSWMTSTAKAGAMMILIIKEMK